MIESNHATLARKLSDQFRQFSQVEAVAISGSFTSGAVIDPASDIDLYVYTHRLIPLDDRLAIVEALGGASRADMNLSYWDLGDEWFDAQTGIEVDVMFWEPAWIESMLERVLSQHQGSLGYSTSHWHTILHSHALFDRNGWFAGLQSRSRQPYPEALRQDIIAKNHAVLRDVIPSYLHQIEKAARRGDLISVNHRVAAFFASYFDIVFAYNRVPNPGEKRLLEQAARLCPRLPEDMTGQVTHVLRAACAGNEALVRSLHTLVDSLERMLEEG